MPLKDVFTYYGSAFLDTTPELPWRLGNWLWATNGHLLVGLKDDGSEALPTPENKLKAVQYLDPSLSTPRRVNFSRLKAFAGAVQAANVPCDECGGDGRDGWGTGVTCEHCGKESRPECGKCQGSGKEHLEPRYANVAGVRVNLPLLAYGLSLVPVEDAVDLGAVESINHKDYQAVIVLGSTWRVVLMCSQPGDQSSDVPAFPSKAEDGAGVGAVPASASRARAR